MNFEWQIRPYDTPISVQEVGSAHPRASIIDIGDNVVLYLKDEIAVEVLVRVTQVDPGGRLLGVIARSNRIGVRGEVNLAKDASVEFEEKQVFRLEKTTQQE